MGSEGTPPPPSPDSSRRKQRRSDDDDRDEDIDEEESKLRKHSRRHHRHHHSRHHRRHHSRHGRDREEAEAESRTVAPASGDVGVPKPDLDEREEGEILEDEEGGFGDVGKGGILEKGGASMDSGPGEVKTGSADGSDDHLALSVEEGRLSRKYQNGLTAPHNAPPDDIMEEDTHRTSGTGPKISNTKGVRPADEREDLENDQVEEGEMDFGIDLPNGGKRTPGDEDYGRGSQYKADYSRSRSPLKVSGNEKMELKDSKHRTKSSSPVSKESELHTKRKRRDESESKGSDHDLDRRKLRRRSESRDVHRNHAESKSRSVSPKDFREKYKVREQSPSYSKYPDEVHRRDRSRSHIHPRESYCELDRHTPRAKSSDSRDKLINDSDNERGSVYDRAGRKDTRSRMRDVEKDKLARRERERSSSHGRHDGQEERHGSLDRKRERERDRGRERERDRERSRDRERVRARDTVSERGRVRDGSDRDNGWDRESRRERDRELGRQMERDRVRDRDSRGDSRYSKYDESEYLKDKTRFKESAKRPNSNDDGVKEKSMREEEEDYTEKIEQQLANQEEEDPEKIIEESRRRRQAILEKYRQQQSQTHPEPQSKNVGKEGTTTLPEGSKPVKASLGPGASEGTDNTHDPSDVYVADTSFSIGKSPQQNGTATLEKTATGGLGFGSPKSEKSADMFCDDIFGESPTGVRKAGKEDNLLIDRSGIHDNWDDAEGYYSYRFGEVLDGRYEIIAAHGKGVFSTVVRAKDLKVGMGDPEEVAIKIIRNNDTMYKAGLEELVILKKLAGADPEDKRHCVRFLSSFKYRNHLCLVFESLHMNLREVLKKFGRNIGLKLTAVRAYAKQLFIALKHLRNCGVLHCDIKPDNMLVNEAKNVLKLCDFGNAMFAGKNEITPYLVSRFYRAPEIILGLPYDHPMDMWSVGCCLFELYNGKVLFPGPSNNDMLRLHMELKGPFPKKMLRKGGFTDRHFDQDLNFHATEEDPVTKKTVKRLLLNIKPRDIGAILTSFPEEDPKMLGHFKDLLERIFVLDPEKRMTVSQALNHPFITGK